uniref:Uncharacterized protein n=1 Tax=Strix occidentalis caurina TaxID=311401 RepID=A0A8D0FLN4_STROC
MNVFDRNINFDALFKFSHISASTQEHLKRVYASFALCMFVAAAGAYINVVTHLFQFSLLTGLGALGLMIWLTATPHSRETEQKRLGMLVGFAFLTGRWVLGTPPRVPQDPKPWGMRDESPKTGYEGPKTAPVTPCCPSRHQPGAPPGNVHLHQPQVGAFPPPQQPPRCPPSPCSPPLLSPSIIPTAFLGTATIFACFSLSALYARRRSFLYLGGERGCRGGLTRGGGAPYMGWGAPHGGPGPSLTPCPLPAGFLLSGLTLMLLSSVVNAFVGSTWLFTVRPPRCPPICQDRPPEDRHQHRSVPANVPPPSRRPTSTWG